jgi:hypothetical protein
MPHHRKRLPGIESRRTLPRRRVHHHRLGGQPRRQRVHEGLDATGPGAVDMTIDVRVVALSISGQAEEIAADFVRSG